MDDLVGKKIKLDVTEDHHTFRGIVYHFERYELDETDALVLQIMKDHPKVRFNLPGECGTMDQRGGRFNVDVEKDGTISKTYYG